MLVSHDIPLSNPGIYFFRPPQRIHLQLNRNLLVVLHEAKLKACGLLLFDTEQRPSQLTQMLDNLWATLEQRGATSETTQAKVFGMRTIHTELVQRTRDWLNAHSLLLSGADTGRNVARRILVECTTGRVGVAYAERFKDPYQNWQRRSSSHQR